MGDVRRRGIGRTELFTVLVSLLAAASDGCSRPTSVSSPLSSVSGTKSTSPLPADAAVRQVLDGLQHRQARAVWEFLPPSYRRDVQQLVRDVATRLDEKSWQPFVATWQQARRVLSQKSETLDSPKAVNAEPASTFKPAALARLLDALGDSELSDLARLRSIALDRFVDQTGDQLLAAFGELLRGGANGAADDPFSRFREVQVELVSSSETAAVVKVRWPEQEPTTHSFVRVEEHWIPQALAEAWPSQFAAVREQCLAWADELREHPEPWHARLREIDQLLDELSATKSFAEMQQVWQTGVSRLAVGWSIATPPTDEPPRGAAPNEVPPQKPTRIKRPDTEVLLPDESP